MRSIIKEINPGCNTRLLHLENRILFPHITNFPMSLASDTVSSLSPKESVIIFPVQNRFDYLNYRNKIATLCSIDTIEINNGTALLSINSLKRIRLIKVQKDKKASYSYIHDGNDYINSSMLNDFKKQAQELIFLINAEQSDKLILSLNYIDNLSQLCDFIAQYFILNYKAQKDLYREIDLEKKCFKLSQYIHDLVSRLNKRES